MNKFALKNAAKIQPVFQKAKQFADFLTVLIVNFRFFLNISEYERFANRETGGMNLSKNCTFAALSFYLSRQVCYRYIHCFRQRHCVLVSFYNAWSDRTIFKYDFRADNAAIVFIEQNKRGNIEFRTDVTQDNEIDITAEGQGNTYRKMLCVTFDLSVLAAYSRKSFYRFVYHDGVYEGLDNRIKTNFIELVSRFCSEYNIQYIFSAIEHDIPQNMLTGFSEDEICLKLDDSGDNGKLFEFSF